MFEKFHFVALFEYLLYFTHLLYFIVYFFSKNIHL